MRCLSCKYDLCHLTEHRCPECGREFDPANPKTYETDASRRSAVRKTVFAWLFGVFITGYFLSLAWLDRYGLDAPEHALLAAILVIMLSPALGIYLFLARRRRS